MTSAGFAPGRRLRIAEIGLTEMAAHCLGCYPEEGCGLLVGDAVSGTVLRIVATENVAHSAQVYEVDPRALLRADREAEEAGEEVIGVFHSHTHTDAYPSPTDIGQAPDPSWHYVVVSLRHEVPSVRSFEISGGQATEEQLVVEPR